VDDCDKYCIDGKLKLTLPTAAKRRITPVKDQNYVTATPTKTTACRAGGYAFAVEAVLEAEFISGYSKPLDGDNKEGYGTIKAPATKAAESDAETPATKKWGFDDALQTVAKTDDVAAYEWLKFDAAQQILDCAKDAYATRTTVVYQRSTADTLAYQVMETDGCQGGEAFAAAALFYGPHGHRINYGDTYDGVAAKCGDKPTTGSGLVIHKIKTVGPTVYEMKLALQTQTFVATGLHVCDDFESYKDGVYTPLDLMASACPDGYLHALLVYGYDDSDEDSKKHHWLVKNSWGTTWGEKGLGKILMVPDKTTEKDSEGENIKDGAGNRVMERKEATPLGLQDAELLTIKWDNSQE